MFQNTDSDKLGFTPHPPIFVRPSLILILLEGIRCIRLFRKYKAEQQAKLQAERDKIEAERAETQRMMQELLELKAQMGDAPGETKDEPKEEAKK